MRNLKRALSLTLASVMLLGMMVMGTSAAGYPDVDDADNVEAIEVLQAVKVMQGDENGNFRPDDSVSRAEMAVVMANLLDLDYQYYEAACPFTDVPAWARGYVGACYANGIVSGYSANTYGANDGVTAVQAASMMMRALGYFQYASDYADGFELSTVRQGTRIGIFSGVGSTAADKAMTRNQVAQMALNALETTMVDAKKTSADITVGSGDTAVSISGTVEYIVRTSNEKFAKTINQTESKGSSVTGVEGATIELGEQLYNGDLEKKDGDDAFGAPATRWLYKNNEIGVYSNEADVTYTTEVKVKDIYKDLGLTGEVTGEDLTIEEDGDTYAGDVTKLVKSGADGDKKLGGNGVLVKAYKTDEDKVTICIINTYVLQVDGEYNSKKSELQLKTPDDAVPLPSKTSSKLSSENYDGLEYFGDKDYVLVTVANKEIQTIKAAETLTETVTAYVAKAGDNNSSSVTAGSTYKYDKNYKAKTYEIGEEYVLVLDNYGYIIYTDGVDTDDQYVYVVANKEQGGVKGNMEADAYFEDGTSDVIVLNSKDVPFNSEDSGAHAWYTYEKKSSGKYELTALAAKDTDGTGSTVWTNNSGEEKNIVKTNEATVKYGTEAEKVFRTNNSTTFIVLKGSNVYVYHGIREVPNITLPNAKEAYVNAVMDGSFAKYVFIESADLGIKGAADDHIYIYDEEPTKTSNDKGDTIYIYKVIKDGELTTATMSGKTYTTGENWTLGLYGELKTDSNGYIEEATRIEDATDDNLKAYKLESAKLDIKGDVLVIGSVNLVMDKDCEIWVSDGDDTATISNSQFTRDYNTSFTGALFVVMDKDEIVLEVYVDESVKAATGLTADPDTNVGGQPDNEDDLKDDIDNADNSEEFEGVTNIITTGLKQSVSTTGTTTTITLTGELTPYTATYNGADKEEVFESLNVHWFGRYQEGDTIPEGKKAGDLKGQFADWATAIKTVSNYHQGQDAGPIGYFSIKIVDTTYLFLVVDGDGNGTVKRDNKTFIDVPKGTQTYKVDFSGVTFAS